MLQRFLANYYRLKSGSPGRRFRNFHSHRVQQSGGGFNVGKVLNIGAGLAVVALGLFLIPAPGPGTMVLILGLAMIGGEFAPMAYALDWCEVAIRDAAKVFKRFWATAPALLKLLTVVVLLAVATSVLYGLYMLFFGRSRS